MPINTINKNGLEIQFFKDLTELFDQIDPDTYDSKISNAFHFRIEILQRFVFRLFKQKSELFEAVNSNLSCKEILEPKISLLKELKEEDAFLEETLKKLQKQFSEKNKETKSKRKVSKQKPAATMSLDALLAIEIQKSEQSLDLIPPKNNLRKIPLLGNSKPIKTVRSEEHINTLSKPQLLFYREEIVVQRNRELLSENKQMQLEIEKLKQQNKELSDNLVNMTFRARTAERKVTLAENKLNSDISALTFHRSQSTGSLDIQELDKAEQN